MRVAKCSLGILLACALLVTGCKSRRQRMKVQATEEESALLLTNLFVADPRANSQLLAGFYDVEQNSWRWTMGRFSVLLRPPRGVERKGAVLQLKFAIPDPVIERLKTLTLSASVNGTVLPPETYSKSGEFVYSRDVDGKLLSGEAVKVDFSLDKVLPPSSQDARELGVIVTTVGLEVK